jgi:phosphate transport system substrate-binding protein
MKKAFGQVLLTLSGVFFCLGCGPSDTRDNPTRGSIRIAADEAYLPLINALTSAYEGIYPKTSFDVTYLPEQRAILAFLQDSVRMVFVSRKLEEREEQMLAQQSRIAKTHHIASDGIALITSAENNGAVITTEELEKVFKGEITNWEELRGKNRTGPLSLVFDDANSSNLLYLAKRFNITDFNKVKISVAGSHQKVIQHIKENPRSIGFIGMNWISDGKEISAMELSEGIHIMGVSSNANADSSKYYYPFQEDLNNRTYPLARELYAITRESHSGLGGGLLTYIARDVGGLIIMKMGLIPRVPYHRDLILQTE